MKKALSLILTLAMLAALTACGNTVETTKAPETTPAETTAAAESKAPETTESAAVTAASIKPAGYPKGGSVTIVCGFNAGGAQDNNCRIAAQYATLLSGDNYVVNNIAGSSGKVAAADVTASPADGLKVYLANLTLADPSDYQYVEAENLKAQMTMNMLVAEQFTAICAMHDDARSITIKAGDSRFTNFSEFDAYVKAHPGELTIGTPGANGAGGLMATLLAKKLGWNFNVVHYTSTNECHAALLGGHIDAEMSVISAAGTDADVAKTIVVASDERSKLFPEVPTMKESGENLSIPTTRCFFVKQGTDAAIVSYLSMLFGEMAENADYINDNLTIYQTTVNYKPAEETQQLIDATYAACKKLIQ